MILTSFVISAFAILVSIGSVRTAHTSLVRTRALERTRHPRHVIRDSAGLRQCPRHAVPEPDRIPIQVDPVQQIQDTLVIEHYAEGEDDLLITPFVSTTGTDTAAAVIAVP